MTIRSIGLELKRKFAGTVSILVEKIVQPTAEEQIQFLKNLQRLLNEGQFVATYKYALLLALADLSVEEGDDSGDAWEIDTHLIAGKFVRYYWRQCVPYIRAGTRQGEVLKQNTGRTAAVVRAVSEIRSARNSIALAARDEAVWNHLIQDVDQVVRTMPLWKLQTLGGTHLDFLYENRQRGKTIELRPGVAYCLRQFHSLVTELVRHHWMLYIRRNNAGALGTTSDLSEFLFGGERRSRAPVQPVLNELQEARCFYCSRPLRRNAAHVDHFIAWSRYPVDLGHNFVLAHRGCNSAKADHLAAVDYLSKWSERNREFGTQLGEEFDRVNVTHDLSISTRITLWAYEQADAVGGLTWVKGKALVPLESDWEHALRTED